MTNEFLAGVGAGVVLGGLVAIVSHTIGRTRRNWTRLCSAFRPVTPPPDPAPKRRPLRRSAVLALLAAGPLTEKAIREALPEHSPEAVHAHLRRLVSDHKVTRTQFGEYAVREEA